MPDRTDVERTPDGHHVVVDGRRWRASDPSIPDTLRQELVDELMAARRAVRTDEARARPRVQDAKVALGERGPKWWEDLDDAAVAQRAECATRALLRHREGRSICPSDVARVIGGEQWRDLMPLVRRVAADLRADGVVVVTQRGAEVEPDAKGPVRINRGPRFDDA